MDLLGRGKLAISCRFCGELTPSGFQCDCEGTQQESLLKEALVKITQLEKELIKVKTVWKPGMAGPTGKPSSAYEQMQAMISGNAQHMAQWIDEGVLNTLFISQEEMKAKHHARMAQRQNMDSR